MIDENKIKQGVILLLEGIGEDLSRPGLLDTPERIAKMYREIVGGMDENPAIHLEKTFPLETQSLVIEKDITFYSICEHHMLPFFGKVHIAYLPDKKVVGLSKLARTVDIFSKRLQIQEQMVEQIAQAIMDYLQPQGVMVIAEAEHLCMTMRGVKKPGSKTMSMVTKGVFTSNTLLQSHFFKAVGM